MESGDSPGSLGRSSSRNTTSDIEYFPAKVGSHRTTNPEDISSTMEAISGLASETRNTSQLSMPSLNASNPHSSQWSQILIAPLFRKSSMKAIPAYVTIILDCGVEFYIEQVLLNLTSEYFAANFRNHDIWIESNSGKIQLPNIREHTFAVFHEWLETGKIDSVQPPSQNQDSREKSTPTPSLFAPVLVNVLAGNKDEIFPIQIGIRLDLLIECYTLGDDLKAPAFQNMLMDEIILEYYNFHCNNNGIPLHNLPFICTATIKSSPLNRLVLDLISSTLSEATLRLAAERDLIPKDLLIDLACHKYCNCLPWDILGCTYYLHPRGEFNSPFGTTCNCNSCDKVIWLNSDDLSGLEEWVNSDTW